MILVIALAGALMCPLFAPAAWALGRQHESRMRARRAKADPVATTGRVIAMLTTWVWAGLLVLLFVQGICEGVLRGLR